MALNVKVQVDDRAVRDALRATRRNIRQDVKRTFDDAARRHTLPAARRLAPGFAAASMTTRGTTNGAWLGTAARGKARAVVAVANFGGTIRTPIIPKRGKALAFQGRGRFGRRGTGGTVFAARVDTPRKIRGLHWMEKAVDRTVRPFARQVEADLAAIIQARIDSGGSHSTFTFNRVFGDGA